VDGDFVLLHPDNEGVGRYGASAIAFDLLRFRDGKIAEHWGGQSRRPPNPSGRTQLDGPTEIVDREKTEIQSDVGTDVQGNGYGLTALSIGSKSLLTALAMPSTPRNRRWNCSLAGSNCKRGKGRRSVDLTPRRSWPRALCTGADGGDLPSGPTALYDLFRIENGKIVEHWDVLTPVPPRDQWKNSNGPF